MNRLKSSKKNRVGNLGNYQELSEKKDSQHWKLVDDEGYAAGRGEFLIRAKRGENRAKREKNRT